MSATCLVREPASRSVMYWTGPIEGHLDLINSRPKHTTKYVVPTHRVPFFRCFRVSRFCSSEPDDGGRALRYSASVAVVSY